DPVNILDATTGDHSPRVRLARVNHNDNDYRVECWLEPGTIVTDIQPVPRAVQMVLGKVVMNVATLSFPLESPLLFRSRLLLCYDHAVAVHVYVNGITTVQAVSETKNSS